MGKAAITRATTKPKTAPNSAQMKTKKKKGRPSFADLQQRQLNSLSPAPKPDLSSTSSRRSARRRSSGGYSSEFISDDFVDEEDEDDDEREEKKVELVVRLPESDTQQMHSGNSSVDTGLDEDDDMTFPASYIPSSVSFIYPEGDHDAVLMDADLLEPDTWIEPMDEDIESEDIHRVGTTGTTILAVLGRRFLIGVTDGRSVENYFGGVLTDSDIKTYTLFENVYAICSGDGNTIDVVTQRVHDWCLTNPPRSVGHIAKKACRELNRRCFRNLSVTFAILGWFWRQEVKTKLRLYRVKRPGDDKPYESVKCTEVVGGSGRRYANDYLMMPMNRRDLDLCKAAGDVDGAQRIIINAMFRARRRDVNTDGLIYMTTFTGQDEPVFEVFRPMDWLFPFSCYHVDLEENTFTPYYYN